MKFFLLGLMLLNCMPAFATQLFCVEQDSKPSGGSSHVVFKAEHELKCYSAPKLTIGKAIRETDWGKLIQRRNDVRGTITARGPGLRIGNPQGIWFNCPLVKFKNLERSDFFGVKGGASAIFVGAQGGLVANNHGGACIITGLDAGSVGFDLSGIRVSFDIEDYYTGSVYRE
jgi:hypothetical protein